MISISVSVSRDFTCSCSLIFHTQEDFKMNSHPPEQLMSQQRAGKTYQIPPVKCCRRHLNPYSPSSKDQTIILNLLMKFFADFFGKHVLQ